MPDTAVASTPLTRAETRVLEAIDEHALVEELVRMIHVPSITGSDAESDLRHWHAAQLAALGFDVDTWKLKLGDLAAHPDYPGTEAPRVEGYGVVGVLGPPGVPALILQAHVDVVPTGDLDRWANRDPWSGAIRHNSVHGRGACDMKAGATANLAIARALLTSGVELERPFALHAVISEEDGGLGAFATMLRGHRGEAAVITEPTSGHVVIANAGALTFEVRVRGCAAHASSRLSGHSALEAFLPLYAAILELERERNAYPDSAFGDHALPYPISIGTVRAGDWASSVPDLLVAQGRLGVQLDEPPGAARATLERAFAETCARDPWLRDHPAEITWPGGPVRQRTHRRRSPSHRRRHRRHPRHRAPRPLPHRCPIRKRPPPLRRHRRHPHPPLRSRRRPTRPQLPRTSRHQRTHPDHPNTRATHNTPMRRTPVGLATTPTVSGEPRQAPQRGGWSL